MSVWTPSEEASDAAFFGVYFLQEAPADKRRHPGTISDVWPSHLAIFECDMLEPFFWPIWV